MLRTLSLCTLLIAGVWSAEAQTRRPYVSATGSGAVSVTPDEIKVSISITTQAPTAQEATTQNATTTSNVLAALRKLLGATGEIKTIYINLSPIMRSPAVNQPAQTVAYLATNAIQVTVSQASTAGAVIDTAIQNGASNVGGLQFGLKDPQPARTQALRLATQQARAHAEAIAFALGRTLGSIVSATESGGANPIVVNRSLGATATVGTPIEASPLEVSANVVLEAELN